MLEDFPRAGVVEFPVEGVTKLRPLLLVEDATVFLDLFIEFCHRFPESFVKSLALPASQDGRLGFNEVSEPAVHAFGWSIGLDSACG